MIVQWDDHEVLNNWNPGTDLAARPQYTERSIAMLAARAKRAMFEYLPIRSHPDEAERVYRAYRYGPLAEVIVLDQRSYRAANGAEPAGRRGPRHAHDGRRRRSPGSSSGCWRRGRRGRSSPATCRWACWSATDSATACRPTKAWANGPGAPLGRELELADVLSFIRDQRDPQRRLGHRRRALRGGAPLRPGGGRVQGLPAVLGVRRRPAPRRHVRAEQARPDVWLHAGLQQRARLISSPTGRPATGCSSSAR